MLLYFVFVARRFVFTECAQTDGQTDGRKEKSITIYLAVHPVHLADIITASLVAVATASQLQTAR